MNIAFELEDQELEWFRGLLRDLKCLEHMEMGGKCGNTLRWLCGSIAQGRIHPHIGTLTVRYGVGEKRWALKLRRLADACDITTTLIYIPDPGVHGRGEADLGSDDSGDEPEDRGGGSG